MSQANWSRFKWVGATLAGSILLVGLLGCAVENSQAGSPQPDPTPIASSGGSAVTSNTVDERLVAANTQFGFKLFSEVAQQSPDQNVLISPSSVAIALGMAYNGADGETQQAMAAALGLENMSLAEVNQANAALEKALEEVDPKVKLAIANSLWGRQGIEFKPDFLSQNEDFYNAEVATLDFGRPNAVRRINAWVNRQTEGKIPTIIDRINPEDVMFLINAIYFKGDWSTPFDPSLTRDRPFNLADGSVKQHPLMAQSGQFQYTETEQAQIVSLPYGNRRMNMVVVLPKADTSLTALQQSLTPDTWATWMQQLQRQPGAIQLPRFKAEFGVGLNEALEALGMGVAFDPNQADFSGILEADGNAYINSVLHKTAIDVNEQGTEAAASTSISIGVTSAPIAPPFQMVVDRPFFYAIQDSETGTVLFMGTVVNPEV